MFDVQFAQHSPIWTRGDVRKHNATGRFAGRNRFDIAPFHLEVEQGTCIGWRCRGRCDLTYTHHGEGVPKPVGTLERSGTWLTPVSGEVAPGHTVAMSIWRPRVYAISA